MTNIDAMIAQVECELAAIDAEVGPAPARWDAGDDWLYRRRKANDAAAERLTAAGAVVRYKGDAVFVRFGNVRASSTAGLKNALRLWLVAARKQTEPSCSGHGEQAGGAVHA